MFKVISHLQENNKMIGNYRSESEYLWTDHIIYTRQAIFSIPAGSGDVSVLTTRLDNNQSDIGNLIRPYYPAEDVDSLISLLKSHINIAAQIISSTTSTTALQTQWQENAIEIVNLMEKMNPIYWPAMSTQPLWSEHMRLTNVQIDSRKTSKWQEDIDAFDANHRCMIDFADLFARGTIWYKIEKFSNPA